MAVHCISGNNSGGKKRSMGGLAAKWLVSGDWHPAGEENCVKALRANVNVNQTTFT